MSTLSAIIGFPSNDSWRVYDSMDNLYLLHYTPDAPVNTYGVIKGMVVDVEAMKVIATSTPYTPTGVSSKLEVASYDNSLYIQDAANPNISYTLNLEETTFHPGFDGPIITLFLHQGQVRLASEWRIDAGDRWGTSPPYHELFMQLGGDILVSPNFLFDTTKDYSPYIHRFILAHPDLQVVSKTPIESGLLVYIGWDRMWEEIPNPQIDDVLREPDLPSLNYDNWTSIIKQPSYDLDTSNDFLLMGMHEVEVDVGDERLLPGEFIFASYTEEGTRRNLRIESTSYRWRADMRGGSPFLLERFYRLSNGKFNNTQEESGRLLYMERFPVLASTPSDKDLELPMIVQTAQDKIPLTVEARLYNIYLVFLYSLPLSQQEEGVDFYTNYWLRIEEVITHLIEIYIDSFSWLDYTRISETEKRIITLAISFAQQRIGEDNMKVLVAAEIRRLVLQSEGTKLFQLTTQI